jgi:transcription initiation factor TFIID TATA-box-binding protein
MNKTVKDAPEPSPRDAKPEWKIENVVATTTMEVEGGKIDLNDVARKHPDCEYNPERFPGLIMRFEDPKFTALLFSTGKAVCTGLRSEDHVKRAVDAIIGKLKKAKITIIGEPAFKVQNIVASGNVHASIDLNEAAVVLDNSIYEPEVFPGLIYRVENSGGPRAVFLIFSTGKVVCTGTKNKEDVGIAMERLAVTLKDFDLSGGNSDDDIDEI